jgi:uncharacterized protein YbcC (UPF0753/DUF2309 family)
MLNIFIPTMSSFVSSSFRHMDRHSILTIEQGLDGETENGCNLGFTADEMAIRVENVLRSIGLIKEFSPIIYVIGHGASSINNPHYAAYDCGACSGRAGSVNARVFATMANHTKVRALLAEKGITIPNETIFLGGLHDTTRDEIIFYDEERLRVLGDMLHKKNIQTFEEALSFNAKERSRRFASINTKLPNKKIHKEIKKRALSIFEPRPELNHATNSLCIVGRRSISKHLFLDRRCFLNSYDYRTDPEGLYLLNILQAVAPVCGGINLEYYFSRVDNQKLGAGSKLPHNVVGLFGVANGADGDLRPGLPSQMIEVHEPVRLLVIVEHSPEVVLSTIQKNPVTYEWFKNEWIHLVALCPATQTLYRFKDAKFMQYTPLFGRIPIAGSILELIEQNQENIPIHLINTLPNHE